jgi:hypothetical protein
MESVREEENKQFQTILIRILVRSSVTQKCALGILLYYQFRSEYELKWEGFLSRIRLYFEQMKEVHRKKRQSQ